MLAEALKRRQEAKPPFPWDSEDVTCAGASPGITLAATLTKPRGAGPVPAELMITGSGPQDRDETMLGHKPFWVIADYLSRRGIAVLRIDDRGMGKSTGNSARMTISEMADDVLKGIAFLKSRPGIDAKHIGVAIERYFFRRDAGRTGRARRGGDHAARRADHARAGRTGRNDSQESCDAAVRIPGAAPFARRERRDAASGGSGGAAQSRDQSLRTEFSRLLSPEMHSFIVHDPQPILWGLKVPVMAINGSLDTQVDPNQNLPAIVNALTAGGNPDFLVMELPGLNHMFQHCKICTPTEFGEIEETFAPQALDDLGVWLARHTGR
jgi:pimeloyl-ACP methyl ester carboxylesterase